MKSKFKKIYYICAFISVFILAAMIFNETYAADLEISASGNTVTISSDYTGRVNLSITGGTLSEQSVWLENNSQQVTVNVTSENGATITATPVTMSDSDGNAVNVGAKRTSIAGTKKEETSTQPTQPAQPTQPTQPQQPAQPAAQDPTFTNTNKTMYTTGNVNLRASWSTSSAATPVNAGTELTVTATSSEKVNGYVWYRVSYNGQTKYIASSLLTATKPAEEDKDKDKEEEKKTDEKSTNKALKDLVVENYKLTPDFDPETTKYTVEVTKEVEKLEITPILQDDKSKFEITGNEDFKVGNNIVKITVTAEDGTNRIYTITVSKSNKDGDEESSEDVLKLSKLQIKDLTLDPEFKPEITNYSVVVSDPSSIKVADITAIAEDEDIQVTIAEAEVDKNGNRVITIMLENEDGTKSGVYQITIKKGMINPIAELQRNKNNRIYYILGGIIGILVIAIIVVIVLLKKTSNKGDIQDIKEADELADDYEYSLKNSTDNTSSEEAPEYDELIEDSNVKSQILTNPTDYNVFEDKGNQDGVSDETKRYEMNDEDDDDEFRPKGKKKGKHF